MGKHALFLALLFLFGCQKPKDGVQEPPFTNFLNYGEYEVGFETLFTVDNSREHVPYSDWGGKLYPSADTTSGRKLPLHLWYPSAHSGKKLSYGHFVNLTTKQTEQELLKASDSFAKEVFVYQANELKGEKSLSVKQLDTLLHLKTFSSLNTKAVQQQFPLVIFPNGSTPSNQSAMGEFLASHGYVVAAISLKGQFSSVIDASVKGLEVAVDDMEFAMQQLLELPNVDGNRIALLANAIESSFCAGLASKNSKINALISLDGGLPSRFEQDILAKTNFYEPQNLSLPILVLYSTHPAIDPEYIYHLKYSERYFAHFPGMSEFHFLNYGIFEKYIPGIIGEAKGDTQKGFKLASELTLAFLDAKLKGKTADLSEWYSAKTTNSFENVIDTLFKKEGLTTPPNMAILKNLFAERGIQAIDSIYKNKVALGDLQPFSQNFFNDFKNWLAWKKDPTYVNRKQLYDLAVESYPNSALNHYRLAYYLNETGDVQKSMHHYRLAKDLLNNDNSLDPLLKGDLKNAIEAALR